MPVPHELWYALHITSASVWDIFFYVECQLFVVNTNSIDGWDVSLLCKSVEICNIKMLKINYETQMCYEKRQNDTTVDFFLWKLI